MLYLFCRGGSFLLKMSFQCLPTLLGKQHSMHNSMPNKHIKEPFAIIPKGLQNK